MIQFLLNNTAIKTREAEGGTVLDFVRYNKHLVGTKIGCREGDCGACTILVGELKGEQMVYQSMTSCLMPLKNAHGKHIVTIEGLNMDALTPVQQAVIEEGGTQCGFCTVGFVVSLTGYTMSEKAPTYDNAIAAIDGNICRCTGYKSLERAAGRISQSLEARPDADPIEWLVGEQFLPSYFLDIPKRLKKLAIKQFPLPNGTSGKESVFVGGGTDLFVQKPEAMAETPITNLFDQSAFKYIKEKDGFCYIGGASTAEDLRSSPLLNQAFPKMHDFMKLVSSTPIRNMGTIAGNFINASPIGDLTIFFLALNAQITLNHHGEKRTLHLKDLYKGYKTLDKHPESFIEEISFELPEPNDYYNFEKVCKRTYLDIASVNTACFFRLDADKRIKEVHLSAGGVAAIPFYLHKTREFLLNKTIDPDLLKEANEVIQSEVSPISDARGSADYKRLLLRQLFYAHFLEAGCVEEVVG